VIRRCNDKEWIYAKRAGQTLSLQRIRSSGGEPIQVAAAVEERDFVPVKGGIWYFTPNTKDGSRLEYYDLTTRSSRTVFKTSRPVPVGLTVSPKGNRLLFVQADRSPSRDLMLVENFR
jgi:hypothetical protein